MQKKIFVGAALCPIFLLTVTFCDKCNHEDHTNYQGGEGGNSIGEGQMQLKFGTAMGSPVSVTIANLVIEQKALTTIHFY